MQPQFFLVVGIATAFRAIPQFGKGHHSSFATTITRNSHIEIPERAIYPATSSPFLERLESMKAAVIGCLYGGTVAAPFVFLQAYLDPSVNNKFAQFEYMTDMSSLQAALFAITYRYVVRTDVKDNENLASGVMMAFILTRTLTSIRVPSYCSASPLDCGGLGYIFDFGEGTLQLFLTFVSSYVVFAATRNIIDKCMLPGWFGWKIIKRFDE